MKKREREALASAGFYQGLPEEREQSKCEYCGQTISGRRMWYRGDANDKPSVWCRMCAVMFCHVWGYLD